VFEKRALNSEKVSTKFPTKERNVNDTYKSRVPTVGWHRLENGEVLAAIADALCMMGLRPMSTSEFKFYCSHCDQPLKCDTQFAGRQIQCPACQHLIRIPNPPAGSGFTHI
jgi:hypothetical protein